MGLMSLVGEIPVLVAVLTFCSLFLFVIGVIHYFRIIARKGALIEKIREAGERPLHTYREPTAPVPVPVKPEEKKAERTESFLHLFSFIGKRLASGKKPDYQQTQIKFLNAGIRHLNAPAIFLGARIFFMLILFLAFLFARATVFQLWPLQLTVLVGITAAVVGMYIPEIWIDVKTARRKKQIFNGLPDALDLMVVCVEAGMGLDSAMKKVSQEIHMTCPPLSRELRVMNLELRAGKSRESALKNLAQRVGLEDMSNLVTMLIQSEKFGTSASRALRVYSDSFRAKRFALAEEQAAKISIKLLFPLIFFIFPALFVVVAGPAMIRIYEAIIKQ